MPDDPLLCPVCKKETLTTADDPYCVICYFEKGAPRPDGVEQPALVEVT